MLQEVNDEKYWKVDGTNTNFQRLFDHVRPFVLDLIEKGAPDNTDRYFFTADGQVSNFLAKD